MSETARTAPENCAQCGADIPPRAHACPECGADERTGWREQSIYDGLDLPDEPSTPEPKPPGHLVRWIVIIITLTLAVLFFFRGALGW